MVARAFTVAFEGVEARMVEVQCSVTAGSSAFNLVGLPDKAVSEARERVRAALNALSIALPSRRITVNLSPADLPKEGFTSICPSRWRCWRNWTSSRATRWSIPSPWASCRWTAG